jgi:transcription elongation factor GreA
MTQRHPMTQEGALRLKAELDRLKTVERRRIIQAIAESRELGDLKENAEYHAAKEEQSFVEGRISEIEAKLAAAQIIDVTSLEPNGKVVFGSTVTVLRLEDDKKETFKIVGDDEVDIKANKISFNSPLARAMIGKFEGDNFEAHTPGGDVDYQIDAVEYLA